MKWFKHMSDSYCNLKHQQVIAQFGLEGYGLYWICLELIAQQGTNHRINAQKGWKMTLVYLTRMKPEKIDELLKTFADAGLIDKKALEQKDLYVPKMAEHSDEYTDKVRRMSRQGRDVVRLEQNRTDKNRTEEEYIRSFEAFWKLYPRKIAKKSALKAWLKVEPESVPIIMHALPDHVASDQWTKDGGRFIPHPATWLNAERWLDEVEASKQGGIISYGKK